MENNANNSNSTGFCEKIFNAVSECLHCRGDPEPTKDHKCVKTSENTKPESDGVVPIKFDHSTVTHVAAAKVLKHNKAKPHMSETESGKEGKRTGQDLNDAFSDYIDRVKIKIRAISKVVSGKNMSSTDHNGSATREKDVLRDHFSDYINRARIKLRTTSSGVNADKSISTKRE